LLINNIQYLNISAAYDPKNIFRKPPKILEELADLQCCLASAEGAKNEMMN
jgi:hypothetical protein